jgi:hypothetical protein
VEENNDEEHAAAHQVGQHAELHVVDHFLCMGGCEMAKIKKNKIQLHAQETRVALRYVCVRSEDIWRTHCLDDDADRFRV